MRAFRRFERASERFHALGQAMKRRAWHRGLFVAAGAYNIAWGIYSSIDPQWLFRFARMAPSNTPEIFGAYGKG